VPESTRSAHPAALWAPRAWLDDGWHDAVLLSIGGDGRWTEIAPGVRSPPEGATVLNGPLLPGLVDAHSHAFQRAFAGLAEQREAASDDFWSWRDRMYQAASRVTPAELRVIAPHLYVELLRGGYTHVCEFHYLHHDSDGRPYADPLEMAWAIADAAVEAGIGLTLLPVLYERAGFALPELRVDQRRFATTPQSVRAAQHQIAAARRPLLNAGLAIHSLRAAAPASIATLASLARDLDGPVHIHVAEQMSEVSECIAATGVRPIEWLVREELLDARWQLVHATHTVPAEIEAVASRGAGVVLCPSTEGNLGDGLGDLSGWLASGARMSIGSDSQVTRNWPEELRWLDYGQRLARQTRNVAAAPELKMPSTAQRLFSLAVRSGAAAAGEAKWGLSPGARADALVVDTRDPALVGIPPSRLLDAVVFASAERPFRDCLVGGRFVVRDHVHPEADAIARRFEAAMRTLWSER
jgi:formimidoylglutamate deiminase